MKNKRKHYFYIIVISSVITYFLFHTARESAILERGNSNAIGGEILLLLLPIICLLIYENIVLSRKTHKQTKCKKTTGIHITGITNIQEVY